MRGIHQSPVNSPHKGQWRGALMFSLICSWINAWVSNREAGDLRRHRAHYDVIVMICSSRDSSQDMITQEAKNVLRYIIHILPTTVRNNSWRNMEIFSALLALCEGNPSVTGGFPSQRPVTGSFDVFFDLRLNKRLSKKSRSQWLEPPSRSLWRQCNVLYLLCLLMVSTLTLIEVTSFKLVDDISR